MVDYTDLATRFKKVLNFKLEPVGVRFFRKDETAPDEIRRKASRDGVKSYCQALIAAGQGRSFLGGADKMGCPLGNAALGLIEEPAAILESTAKEKHKAGIFETEQASRNSVSGSPRFSPGLNGEVLVGPLGDTVDEPDIVVLEVFPQEAMWVLYGSNYRTGGGQPLIQSGGVAGGCADIGAGIILSDKVNITFLGLACRIKSGIAAEHLLMGLTAAGFGDMVEALEKMSGPIAKLAGVQAGH